MAKYNYIVSGAGKDLWVGDDGNFECLVENDKPTDYQAYLGLNKARVEVVNNLLKSGYECVIYKFEGKPPYKYLGEVV